MAKATDQPANQPANQSAEQPAGTVDTTERIVLRLKGATDRETWEVARNSDGQPRIVQGTKAACIDKIADGAPGRYKAVSLRAWKGTRVIEIPEKPEPVTSWEDE